MNPSSMPGEPAARPDGKLQEEALRSVERAVAVLEFVASRGRPIGPSEISRDLRLSKTIVIRILQTWLKLGYVLRTNGEYELGWKVVSLANARSDTQELHRAARRYMAWLSEFSGETIHLAVPQGAEVLYVDKIDGHRSVRVSGDIGRTGPMSATASGKAILANLPEERSGPLLSECMTSWTRFTISDPERLRRELKRTRERGYAINRGEWHESVGGVGAVVFSRDGNVEAALSILYPVKQADRSRIAALGEQVSIAAQRLSFERGWRGSGAASSPEGTLLEGIGASLAAGAARIMTAKRPGQVAPAG